MTGIGIGVASVLIGLFILVQYNPLDSEDFRVVPQTAWFEYRADCVENLCYVRFLEPYYNSTTLKSDPSGNLEGSDFAMAGARGCALSAKRGIYQGIGRV